MARRGQRSDDANEGELRSDCICHDDDNVD